MTEILDTDAFLVQRGNDLFQATKENLMATIQDTDLMVVNRVGVNYSITGAELRENVGNDGIQPGSNDISISPSASGSGTEADPFLLSTVTIGPYGASTQSNETLTITGQAANEDVVWKNNSTHISTTRFEQPDGITNGAGVWTGKLLYTDTPESTADNSYVGNLQIGSLYFRWYVDQQATAETPPVIGSATLSEDDPTGDRFTSQSYTVDVTMTAEGVPASDKQLKGYVEGTLTKIAKSGEIATSNTSDTGDAWKYPSSNAVSGGNWDCVAAGGGTYITLDQNTADNARVVGYTYDINNWNTRTSPVGAVRWANLVYGDGKFVAVGAGTSNSAMYTKDMTGNSWGACTGLTANNTQWTGITYGGGKFVAVNATSSVPSAAAYSTDGINWTMGPAEAQWHYWNAVTYGNDRFVAVSISGGIMHSLDGINWTVTLDDEVGVRGFYGIAYGNGKFVATGTTGTSRAWTSTDGITWEQYDIGNDSAYMQGIAFGDGKFVAVSASGEANTIYWSYDGENWNSTYSGRNLMTVAYGNDMFLLGGYGNVQSNPWYSTSGTGVIKSTSLTFDDSTGLDDFSVGVPVTSYPSDAATGMVASVDANSKTMVLAPSAGAWVNTSGMGVVADIGTDYSKMYTVLTANGAVLSLVTEDPGYITMAGNPDYTLTFPAMFPSGDAPDTDLPAGTSFTVDVKATNTQGSSEATTNTLVPGGGGTFYIDNPSDVTAFNNIKAQMTNYEGSVAARRARIEEDLNEAGYSFGDIFCYYHE